MAKNSPSSNTPPEAVISIIGAGMIIEGDSVTDGSLRIEGTIRGSVRAGKSVVVGRDGLVDGSIYTQDAVISGRVSGGVHAVSRLELLATSEVSGEIEAPRMQVEEGAKMHGQVTVGEGAPQVAQPPTHGGGGKAEGQAEPKASEEVEPEPEAKASEKAQAKPEPKASEEGKPGRRSEALGEVAREAEELEAVQQEHSRD
jgi:cytoskeletal protein CcmA (bactofilin family)